MKKRCLLSISLLLVVALQPLMGIAQEYRTIQQIREQAPDRWCQSYNAKGETINIDIPISIPTVSTVPVVEIGFADGMQPFEPTLYNDTFVRGNVLTRAEVSPNSWHADGTAFPEEDADAQAENSPLSASEAREYAVELIQKYESQTGKLEFQLQGSITWSRRYQKIKSGLEQIGVDMEKPITDMGCYQMRFHQVFHGISYILPGYYAINAKNDDHQRPLGTIDTQIASREDYLFDFFPAIERGMLVEDVPLVPFSDVITAFEEWISAGLIRDAYELRFGYMIYDNPNDFTNSFYLLPVWELRCVVMQEATQETPTFSDEALLRNQRIGSMSVVVEAQTGKLLDLYHDRSGNRQLAEHILTWDEVN